MMFIVSLKLLRTFLNTPLYLFWAKNSCYSSFDNID
jgi:hypothetical protein